MINIFSKLHDLLTRRDKHFLLGLFVFSIFISIIETVGISAIMPFIAVATDFSLVESSPYYLNVYTFFSFENPIEFVLSFGVVLVVFYILRSLINLLYFHLLVRFSQGRYHLLAYRLFENYLGMGYKEFVKKNSSTLTKSIINEASHLTQLVSAILFMLSEVFIVILIYGMMLYVNYKITIILTVVLLVNAVLMVKTVSVKIKNAGEKRTDLQKVFYEIINKSFGNFKLIKLQNSEKDLLEEFSTTSYGYAKANVENETLSHVPRLFLEAAGFSVIIFIVAYLVWKYENNVTSVLSLISMFVLALYRLMPSVNRILSSYNQIMFNYKSLEIVHNDLMYNIDELGSESVVFEKELRLENISFEYEDNKLILKDISLTLLKGEKIAFVGESGSGKSTLVDIIIGLYRPKDGRIIIDGKVLMDENICSWRSKIGYIPQTVYLFDGTVGENVAFAQDYNQVRIDECLKQAKIYDFLVTKNGTDTLVGEGGIRLSGGQKQRIAIARALYSQPEVLVLDEATSALDYKIEAEIMEEIYELSKDKTLIIIAHRLSTINNCNKVYTLNGGVLCG